VKVFSSPSIAIMMFCFPVIAYTGRIEDTRS
jgi:hypothetical protein